MLRRVGYDNRALFRPVFTSIWLLRVGVLCLFCTMNFVIIAFGTVVIIHLGQDIERVCVYIVYGRFAL